jgi:hypothetical protein
MAAAQRCRRRADKPPRITPWTAAARSLEHFQLVDEIRVAGHTFLDKADDPLFIDKIGKTSSTIGAPELFVAVRHQGKLDTILFDEFLDGVHIVVADPDYFRIELFEFFQVTLEVSQFTCSD